MSREDVCAYVYPAVNERCDVERSRHDGPHWTHAFVEPTRAEAPLSGRASLNAALSKLCRYCGLAHGGRVGEECGGEFVPAVTAEAPQGETAGCSVCGSASVTGRGVCDGCCSVCRSLLENCRCEEREAVQAAQPETGDAGGGRTFDAGELTHRITNPDDGYGVPSEEWYRVRDIVREAYAAGLKQGRAAENEALERMFRDDGHDEVADDIAARRGSGR